MSKSIEAKAIISAEDKTGQTFDKVAKKIEGVSKAAKAFSNIKPPQFVGDFGANLDKLKATEKELAIIRKSWMDFDKALKSGGRMRASTYLDAVNMWKSNMIGALREVRSGMDEHERHQRRFFQRAGRFAVTAAGLTGGAYLANRAGRAGIGAAATAQRESARDYLAGLSSADSDRLAVEALRQSSRYRSVDASTMHERLRDTAMSTRSIDKAVELGETIAQGTTVLQSLKGKDKAIEEGRKFFSALDVMGKNLDPKEVRELFDGYIKALGVEGADMDLGGVLQMARQSRAAGGILSNRFLMSTAPGLGRDLGDSQLGTALASALSQNIGGRATKASKEMQQKFGLRDASGNFVDSRLAMTDPDYYAWKRLMPALQKKGIDTNDNVAVTKALSQLFSNRTVQDVFSKLITQREQYEGKAQQYERAPGLAAAGPLATKDPFVAFEAVQAQLRNLASQAPMIDAAAAALDKLSSAISTFTKGFSESTTGEKAATALGIGTLGAFGAYAGVKGASGLYQWFTGAAQLNVAATSLQAAATELTAAAAMLRGKSVLPNAVPAATNAATSATSGAAGASIWTLGARALAFAPPAMLAAGIAGGLYAMRTSVSEAGYDGLTSGERMRRQRGGRSVTQMLREEWGYGTGAPELTDTMTYGTGVSGDRSIEVHGEGQIDGKMEVTFTAGSELITLVGEARRVVALAGQMNINGPGSRGISSPDAAAGARGFGGAGGQPY